MKGTVIIGVVNHEGNTANYEVVVQLNNVTLKNETIKLANKEEKNTFTFNPYQSGK